MEKLVILKSESQVDLMRRAGQALAQVVKSIKSSLKVGMTTLEIDRIAEESILKKKAKPAFKGYCGFPCSICASFNEEVVHGIPSLRKIQDGDILSLDMGLILDGWIADTAFTIGFGSLNQEVQSLLEVTENALFKGIEQAREGNFLSDIGFAIQSYAEGFGFSVVRDFVGHGIGQSLHEAPEVPNFGLPKNGPRLKPGMTLAIEPMVNLGGFSVKTLEDRWTVVTTDGRPSAHFEHTIVITDQGPEILTQVNG
jgi:methionyl aminopeptidase